MKEERADAEPLSSEPPVAEGHIGETVAFDPNRHELLGSDIALTPGQSAVVRIVGASYRGKVLRKVGVEVVGE